MALAFTGAYLLGGLTLGTLCAWFGAWLALRPLPATADVAEAPGAGRVAGFLNRLTT